jgi:D-3-phosphoglycerate dehydrogenase
MWTRTVGLVGIGRIGTHVARICGNGFGMRVIAYDPYLSHDEIAARGAQKVDALHELLSSCDIISVHATLTAETRGLIGTSDFAAMKPTAILVNTARGPIVEQAALVDALEHKRIAGAGIDVFEDEPPGAPSSDNPLLRLKGVNVVFSPHNAGLTLEGARQLSISTVEVALDVLHGRKPATLLNPEVWNKRRHGNGA